MAPRALGALFALVAALLFATAFAGGSVPKTVPGWWDGHPQVDGKVLTRKAIHVGLLEADGCNLGENVTCEELETGHALDVVGISELAALGLGAITCLVLAISAWQIGDRRRFLAKLVLFEVLLISAGAATIFVHGPDLRVAVRVAMPVGLGLMAVAAGAATAVIGSLLAMRVRPEPLRLKTSDLRVRAHHQQQPAFDVRDLLPTNVPHSPGGPLAGPSGPLAAPLFQHAPHLRPLYDMQNVGAAPMPVQPQAPRMPTPMPPPLETVTPPTYGAAPDAPLHGDSAAAHVPVHFGADPYVPPNDPFAAPARPKRMTRPQRPIEDTQDLDRESDPELLAPPPAPIEAPTTPMRGNKQPAPNPRAARAAAAQVPSTPRAARPSVPAATRAGKQPTTSTTVPPMPATYVEPPSGGGAEVSTAVEIDAEAKARAKSRLDASTEESMTVPVDRPSDSLFDQTNELRTPENFDEMATDAAAARRSARELGLAHTELATVPAPSADSARDFEREASPEGDDSDEDAPDDLNATMERNPRSVAPPPAPTPRTVPPEPSPPTRASTLPRASAEPPRRGTNPPPSPQRTTTPPPRAAAMKDDREFATAETAVPAAPIAFLPPPLATVTPSEGVTHVAPPKRPSTPSAPPPVEGTARSTPWGDVPPEAPTRPTPPPDGAPTTPFAITPSAATLAPTVPTVPTEASAPAPAKRGLPGMPLPRTNKPSVAPAFRVPIIGAAPRPMVPATPAMPSNLEPAATANKGTTSSSSAPFATIPSPFGPKPPLANADTEAPTAPATVLATVLAEAEAPTQPARDEVPASSPEAATVPAASARFGVSSGDEAPTLHATSPRVPISTAPASLPPPKEAVVASSGPTPACPQCEAPMAWVEEHLRFYCASCRMYF